MVGYDACIIDFALNLFLLTKTASMSMYKAVPHSQISGLNTEKLVKID